MKVLLEALRRSKQGVAAALVTVIETTGSTPRHPGARMLVTADGHTFGSIGGGRIEHEIVVAAQEVAQGGQARLVRHHLVRDLGMCCGGSMELYLESVQPSLEAIERLVERRVKRQPSILETKLDGSAKSVLDASSRDKPHRDGEVFLEPVWPAPRIIIFGFGHLARSIGPLAASLSFEVVLCDDNETDAIEVPPPWAKVVVNSFELVDVERQLGPLGVGDYLLILTRDHAIDQRIVEKALPRVADFEYLGLIGSLGKIGRFKKRILNKGAATEEQWKKLRAPIGLDIAAETPEEIAVSIMAELIRLRNGSDTSA